MAVASLAGVTETPDPLAGSYYIETLTSRLEAAAQEYLDEIDAAGGTLAAIEAGFQQRQIQESAYRVQQAIEAGDQVVVGVNRFRDEAGGSTRTGSVARSSASGAFGQSGIRPPGRLRSGAWRSAHAGARTSCRQ